MRSEPDPFVPEGGYVGQRLEKIISRERLISWAKNAFEDEDDDEYEDESLCEHSETFIFT